MKYIVLLSVMCLCGCGLTGWAKEAGSRAISPMPDGGPAPVATIVRDAPALVSNPTDVGKWWDIIDSIAYIVSGTTIAGALGLGVRKAYRGIRDTVPVPQDEYKVLVNGGSKV